MDDNNISERLKELARGKNRSATERLREKFDEIEEALNARARRKDVYQALKECGFEITFASFELAIYRIRKERHEQQKLAGDHNPKPQWQVLEGKKGGGTEPVVAVGTEVVVTDGNTPAAPGKLTSILRSTIDLKQFKDNN